MIKKLFILKALVLFLCAVMVQAQSSDVEIISISMVNQIPDPASVGETVELRFRVENLGGMEANNVEIELIPEYPFLELPGQEYVKTVETLSGYQAGDDAEIIKYKVRVDKDAVKGAHEIKIKEGKAGSASYSTKNFDVEVSGREYAQIIYVDKAKLDPGKETKLKFTITNTGNSPLQNIVFSWNEVDGVILPVYSDDTKYIKYIDVGESADVEYTVVADVNAVAGLYQLNLNLEFQAENGTYREINTKAGVFVGGETDFDVTFSESSAGQTSLSVANTGNNPALSVTVRIPEQDNYRVTGSTSSIVGNLDKGDYTIVSFQITQASSMPSLNRTQISGLSEEERQKLREQFSQGSGPDRDLKVLIEYTDTAGVRRTIEKSVPIQFRSASEDVTIDTFSQMRVARQRQSVWKNPKVMIPLAIAVLVVGGIFAYRKRKSITAFAGRVLGKKR